jgi:hypothetical protein
MKFTALPLLGFLSIPYHRAACQQGCETTNTLKNGAAIQVAITWPTNGQVFPNTGPINIAGTASIGKVSATPNVHWTYVIDVSASTYPDPLIPFNDTSCGIPAQPNKTKLECENDAINALNAAVITAGTAVDVGLSWYAGTGMSKDFDTPNKDYLEDPAKLDTIKLQGQDEVLPGTDFTAGLEAALNSVSQTTATIKKVVFLSDGIINGTEETLAAFDTAVANLVNENATIFSFAIGSGSICGNTTDESLQRMADASGGKCEEVTNPADLANIVAGLLATQLTALDVTVNDGVSVLAGATLTPSPMLPEDGPFMTNITLSDSFVIGSHRVCLSAVGQVDDGPASSRMVKCCVDFEVEESTPAPMKKPKPYKKWWKPTPYKKWWKPKKRSKASKGNKCKKWNIFVRKWSKS